MELQLFSIMTQQRTHILKHIPIHQQKMHLKTVFVKIRPLMDGNYNEGEYINNTYHELKSDL